MDRHEAIKIVKEFQLWRLDKEPYNWAVEDVEMPSLPYPYTSKQLTQAIDTLIAPMAVTDEMVKGAADALYSYTEPYNEERCLYKHHDRERILGYEEDAILILNAALGGE